ncbi:MAG: DUF2721 domain-containing protein [Dongiaceae bacterium]
MLDDNPFAVLSFIAGPALLTNATTVLLLSTVNRYARALDRARHLAGRIATIAEVDGAEPVAWLERQLDMAHRRVLLIVRTLTAFYTAVGAFGLGTLAFLTGAMLLEDTGAVVSRIVTLFTLGTTVVGVLCLIFGSGRAGLGKPPQLSPACGRSGADPRRSRSRNVETPALTRAIGAVSRPNPATKASCRTSLRRARMSQRI